MIDKDGFRPNVGMVIVHPDGRVLWAKRAGHDAWQFPQGGMKVDELPGEALFRELKEEIGLSSHEVEIIGSTKGWLHYRIPSHYLRVQQDSGFVGQKQKWFLLRLIVPEKAIQLDQTQAPEFDRWRWVSYWYPLGQIISFKREVYRRALKELSPFWIDFVQKHLTQTNDM